MSPRPLRVALTGGIATGKSHCLARFAALGVPTIDADVLARDAVAPKSAGLDAIARRFGSRVITSGGALDRGALAQLVFADPDARRDLEAIVHPIVYAGIEQWYSTLQAPIGIADIPLLFETGRESNFAAVVATWCPPEQQIARLHARGLSREEIDARLASQWPANQKADRADFVIDTTGAEAETDRQVENILSELRRLSAG